MSKKLDKPIVFNKIFEKFEKGKMGKEFKKDTQLIISQFGNLTEEEKQVYWDKLKECGEIKLTVNDKEHTVSKE